MQGQSDIARLKAQIDAESAAAWNGLHGLGLVARHKFIHSKYERLGQLGDQLERIVGKDAAIDTIIDSMNKHSPQ